MFLSEQHLDSEILAGLAVAVIMDGSLTLLYIVFLLLTACVVLKNVNFMVMGGAFE